MTNREFIQVSISVLTISDSRSFKDDKSGNLLEKKIIESGHKLFDRKIVRDEMIDIQSVSKAWIDNPSIEVILSTGGTGLTGRDVSPEAFREIFDKEIEGFGELFRQLSFNKIEVTISSPFLSISISSLPLLISWLKVS